MSNWGVCRDVIIGVFVVSDNDAYMIINVILIVRNWEGKIGETPVDGIGENPATTKLCEPL